MKKKIERNEINESSEKKIGVTESDEPSRGTQKKKPNGEINESR